MARQPARSRLKSWSFSTWNSIQKCPARVKYQKIDRLPDPAGPAAERGKAVHSLFEECAKTEGGQLPGAYRRWQAGLDKLLDECLDFKVEMQLAFDKNWKETSWSKGILRSVLDLVVIESDDTIRCIDYKTGRVYPEHIDQLNLYATMLFAKYPWCERVIGADWYLDQELIPMDVAFERTEFSTMLAIWSQAGDDILARTEWPAKRNSTCKWCPYSSKKGGPCLRG